MASTYFLQLDGIEGLSGDKGHEKWIEVISFQHGSKQNTSIERSGDVSGRGQFTPFEFVHAVDKATPKLQSYCVTGQKIGKATFQYSRVVAGAQVPVYEVVLENCRVAKAEVETISVDGKDDLSRQPVEKVSLVAGKITWKVVPIKADGSKDGAIEASFDQLANA
ncbi:MAG: type VI secretion system tube protein Hcp [Spirochaetaceae bacterium]|jgi:type VI secretion system Hcp family effector|nr:type VI secretion system tube protein Hcp [Spirochaetaceae bacterium]